MAEVPPPQAQPAGPSSGDLTQPPSSSALASVAASTTNTETALLQPENAPVSYVPQEGSSDDHTAVKNAGPTQSAFAEPQINHTVGLTSGGEAHTELMKRGQQSSIDSEGLSNGDYKRQKLEDPKVGDSRVQSLKGEAASESNSPSSSRHSTPGVESPVVLPPTGRGFGGAKRRNGNEPKALPRNIDRVYLGDYDIKTWYHSPYPIEDDHSAAGPSANGNTSGAHRTPSSASKMKIRLKNGARTSKPGATGSDTIAGTTAPLAAAAVESPVQQLASSSTPSTPASASTAQTAASAEPVPKIPHLWICEGCFKYMRSYVAWNAHKRECRRRHPPGRKVYQRGAHIIWEVDGAKEKLYAQNLSLFGKLFIDQKTIFFDVEPFLFYVVTDAAANFDYVLGFFSKEKVSYDDYNLACIITFPPYQKKGFGTLMIEFSYLLSSRAAIVGTPERPLSELGFKGYLSYWSAVVLRTLALAFNESDPEVSSRLLPQAAQTQAVSPSKAQAQANAASGGQAAPPVNQFLSPLSRAQHKASRKSRSVLLGIFDFNSPFDAATSEGLAAQLEHDEELTVEELADLRKVRRSALGFAGEVPPALAAKLASLANSPAKNAIGDEGSSDNKARDGESTQAEAGMASSGRATLDRAARHLTPVNSKSLSKPLTHGITLNASGASVSGPSPAALLEELVTQDGFALATTLERLSRAANLRIEDTAFALSECGLLKSRLPSVPEDIPHLPPMVATAEAMPPRDGEGNVLDGPANQGGPHILITRQAVRDAILQRNIKRPVLDPHYVFL